MHMSLIKSLILTAAALSSTAVLAEDGSERASQAAQKMRVAQEARFIDQNSGEASRFLSADEQSRTKQLKKSEG
nr:hypothetical protein [Pseudomonas syringae]